MQLKEKRDELRKSILKYQEGYLTKGFEDYQLKNNPSIFDHPRELAIFNREETLFLFNVYYVSRLPLVEEIPFDYAILILAKDTDWHTNYEMILKSKDEILRTVQFRELRTFKKDKSLDNYIYSIYPLDESEKVSTVQKDVLTFGKYKGLSYRELYITDRNYFNWLLKETKNNWLRNQLLSI